MKTMANKTLMIEIPIQDEEDELNLASVIEREVKARLGVDIKFNAYIVIPEEQESIELALRHLLEKRGYKFVGDEIDFNVTEQSYLAGTDHISIMRNEQEDEEVIEALEGNSE